MNIYYMNQLSGIADMPFNFMHLVYVNDGWSFTCRFITVSSVSGAKFHVNLFGTAAAVHYIQSI